MAPTIITLLKTHPVSLTENLKKICHEIGLKPTKLTKTKMQCEIDDLVSKQPNLEEKVREIAEEMTHNAKKNRENHNSEPHHPQDENQSPQNPQTTTLSAPPPYPIEVASLFESINNEVDDGGENRLKRQSPPTDEEEECEENDNRMSLKYLQPDQPKPTSTEHF